MEKKDRSSIHLEELENFDFNYDGDWKIKKKKTTGKYREDKEKNLNFAKTN